MTKSISCEVQTNKVTYIEHVHLLEEKNQFPSYDGRTEKVNYKVASIQKRESNSKGHQISILSIYLNFNLV